jgi:hypothetical protein
VRHWRPGGRHHEQVRREMAATRDGGPFLAAGMHFDCFDLASDGDTALFEGALVEMARELRSDARRPDLPCLFTRVSPVRVWQEEFPARFGWMHGAVDRAAVAAAPAFVVTCDDFGYGTELADDQPMHYLDAGYTKWAARAVAALKEAGAVEKAHALQAVTPEPYAAMAARPVGCPVSRDPEEALFWVHVRARVVSHARTPAELAPYTNAVMTVVYDVLRSEENLYGPARLVGVHPSLLGAVPQAARKVEPGGEYTLVVASWEAQPAEIRRWPMDDDSGEFDLPLYRVLQMAPGLDEKARFRFVNGQLRERRQKGLPPWR